MINYFKYQINLYNELYKCIRMSGRYCGFENLAALQGFPSLCLAFFCSVKMCHGAAKGGGGGGKTQFYCLKG